MGGRALYCKKPECQKKKVQGYQAKYLARKAGEGSTAPAKAVRKESLRILLERFVDARLALKAAERSTGPSLRDELIEALQEPHSQGPVSRRHIPIER